MLVLGLQGSPRKKGNTSYLLKTFMDEVSRLGVKTLTIDVPRKNIVPCNELVVCEKKGFCPIDDDMAHEIYPLLREADIIVAASPVFFYHVSAQLKALIDRCQTLWARKYCLKLEDPARNYRRGILLAAGATKGKKLFDGTLLSIRYFFDVLDMELWRSLLYRSLDFEGDILKHPDYLKDAYRAGKDLFQAIKTA